MGVRPVDAVTSSQMIDTNVVYDSTMYTLCHNQIEPTQHQSRN
ncbi:uncharacterized protein METZ01_LOCUS322112, partial [marine metagenome]